MKTTNLFWPFRLTALEICTLVLASAIFKHWTAGFYYTEYRTN